MENRNYFVRIVDRSRFIGPFSFKNAISERDWFSMNGEQCEIYKLCVNPKGELIV